VFCTRRFALAAAAFAVAACSNQSTVASTDEALSRDLALAAAEAVELAPSGGELELAPSEVRPPVNVPQRASNAPRPSPRVEPTVAPVSIEPAEIVAIVDEPQMQDAPVGVPDEVERPAPSRRPAPIPASVPIGGDGPNDGGGIGPIIGVVIRGGAVGHDDCAAHRRPRPGRGGSVLAGAGSPIGIARGPIVRGGVAINNRIPVRGVGTFPR
jgi:hypothetical protein